ncbi:ABC transporter permease subunit [Flocculibacter collagenilyticus]|uniref:ABC transporter permease subunit n=1 Tax=Flocculibacter collagenilyticus TaxID=2744479 RepID=UPI0018F6ADB3|nr:ABC transporter permease subunit [Flocculibacter collagenilyticus]
MAKFKLYYEEYNLSPFEQLWNNFKKNHLALLGLWCFTLLLLIAIWAPVISPYDPNANNSDILLMPPSWVVNGQVNYLFGTDDLGRDIFSRLLVGTSYTFGLSILSVLCAMIIGLILGSLAGLSKGVKSSFLNHILDIALSIPSLLIAIIIVAILGPGLLNTVWAVILALLPQFIHSIRNSVQEELQKDYVTAYKMDGASPLKVLFVGIFPNIFETLVIVATMAISSAILDITALGFLGLGAHPPLSEWGAMLADSLDLLSIAPWTVALPGIMIFISVFSTNLVGDGLRDALKRRRES